MAQTTQDSTSTGTASQLTPDDMRGLAARLRARAQSVLLKHQPEQHRDLLTAASLIDQLADLTTEVLSSAAVIERLAHLLRIAGGVWMPGYIRSGRGDLVVTFTIDGEDPEIQLVSSGEQAVRVAVLMIARRPRLYHGDALTVRNADEAQSAAVLRGPGGER